MKEEREQKIQRWVVDNYKQLKNPLSFYHDFNEATNTCSLSIELLSRRRGGHKPLKVNYTGAFDETFFPMAKFSLDRQIYNHANREVPKLKEHFLHLLN